MLYCFIYDCLYVYIYCLFVCLFFLFIFCLFVVYFLFNCLLLLLFIYKLIVLVMLTQSFTKFITMLIKTLCVSHISWNFLIEHHIELFIFIFVIDLSVLCQSENLVTLAFMILITTFLAIYLVCGIHLKRGSRVSLL